MNAITLVFFLVLFVGFILFVVYVIHSVTLLYLPQISSLENYPEAIYFSFLESLEHYLPEKFACYYNTSGLPNLSFCIPWNSSSTADVCIYDQIPQNITCPVTILNLSLANLQSLNSPGYNLINYSGTYFTLAGGRLIVLINYSSYNESRLLNVLKAFYKTSYAISVPQFFYIASNISQILARSRVDAVLLSNYPSICVEYLRPQNGLRLVLELKEYRCSSDYLDSVVANSTSFIEAIHNLQYDTYVHLYLFPNPKTTQLSLINELINYYYSKLSSCAEIVDVNASYNLATLGNCGHGSRTIYFYVARRTLVGLENYSYSLTQQGNLVVLEVNYTLPVLYFRVSG